MQQAYQIIVDDEAGNLIWDSGKVKSDQSILLKYSDNQLNSICRDKWKVRIWDNNGKSSAWSKISEFTT